MAAYFVGDKVTDDPLGAVAAGMRVRVAQIHRPRLVSELDRRLFALPKERWPDVAIVSEGDGDGKVSIVSRGRQFHASVDQWGTDESKLYAALTGLTTLQRHALDLWYQAEHGSTIDKELEDELEDAELDRARALMAGDELRADAAAIRDALEGPGTDEQEIYRALRNKTADERARLEQIYVEMYHVSLQEDIDSDMDGQEFQRADALRRGETARADAIGLEMAKTGRWYGGADTEAIQDIYAQNRLEVEQKAQREGWTADRMRQESLARLDQLDRAHRKEYKDGENDGAGLQASFRATLTGPALDLAVGLQQLDLAKADAARLELEKRSFITDDKVVTKILESQYDRAETEARLDAEHRLTYRADLAAVRGERWDEDRAKRERAATEAEVTVEAGRRAEGYMSGLKKTYNDTYATDLMSLQHGPGGFDALLEHGLQGSDEDRAKALVASRGRLNPAQEIKYAVQGAGTDLDVIKRMLAGRTKDQIREIERQWKELYPDGPSLRDRIMDDVSGRDAIDLDEMLAAPETPREKLESARRRQQFEGETFALGGTFAEEERKALDADVQRLQEAADEYDRLVATPNPDPQRLAYLKWRADQETKAVDSAVEEHRRAADSVTDKIAMVAAVVAGAIVTAVTWGAAGPFVAGALGALAAAEATIITKMAVKGAAYSEEELLVDVVSGVVDIVLAVATAGIGNAMLRVTKGVPVGRLAAMATSASRAKRMLAHGVANGVEGLISGIPSGAAGALADEKTWSKGDVLGTVLTASAMGAASGAVMGGLMGSAGGWKAAPVPLNLPPGSMPEAAARAAQWRTHQQQHPNASYADFARDFDAGRIRAAPDAAATFQRAAQDALGSGLTRAERKALDGVSVTVLSDAEFARLTRSKKAQAVTVVESGKPRVVMRESASLSALREEGIHVAQALDPKLAGHFKLLDEAVLAGWDQLPLGTKLAVYAAKLDLEADANSRLLRGLVAEANGLPPGAVRRKTLLARAAEVGDTLDTLLQRQRELRSFGPLDRVRARLGLGRLADRLDQPPRLFTKKGTKAARAGKAAAIQAPPASKPRRVTADRATWGKQPDLAAPRQALKGANRSPQTRKPGVLSVEQVGEPWREWSHRGKRQVGSADRYRLVAVTSDASPPAGRVKVTHVPETVVRGSRPPRWVMRGSHAAEAGSVAEVASLAMTRRHIAAMEKQNVKVVTLGSGMQNRSGQGFDEVYFEFHPDGTVKVVIVEVKDYGSRHVPLGDFTAVTGDILKGNLARLRTVVNQKRGRLPVELQSLTPKQLRDLRKQVNRAVTDRAARTLEVRLGAQTRLGGQKALKRRDAALRKLGRTFKDVRQGDHLRLTEKEVDLAGRIAEVELPPASSARLLDTHEQLARAKIVDRVLEPIVGHPGLFTGTSGRVSAFRAVTPAEVPDANAVAALASDVVARLQKPVLVPGKAAKSPHVILDLSGLDAGSARKVNAAVDKTLAATGQATALGKRLHRPGRTGRIAP
ncbi:hypothetical protein [Nocardioides aequoreus]|uniref:hypothetical protein n=1 Tax=Nocardioides aequoreus TaxID=397278 RepID=UPI0004C2F48C|nr:hypothetical protein [Nocardioides aequoreus]